VKISFQRNSIHKKLKQDLKWCYTITSSACKPINNITSQNRKCTASIYGIELHTITKYITPTISNVTTKITGISKERYNFHVLKGYTEEIEDIENVQSCLILDCSLCTHIFSIDKDSFNYKISSCLAICFLLIYCNHSPFSINKHSLVALHVQEHIPREYKKRSYFPGVRILVCVYPFCIDRSAMASSVILWNFSSSR